MDVAEARPNSVAQQPIWLLGALLCALSSTLVAAALVLGLRNDYGLTYLVFIVNEPLGVLVGGLIIARQPRNPVGWLIVGHAFCFIGGEFCRQYAIYGVVTAPGSLPYAHAVAWPAYWLWGPGIAFGMALLPLLFPDGRLVSPRWRWVVWLIIITMTSVTINMSLRPGDIETPGVPNPLGVLSPLREDSGVDLAFSSLWVVCPLIGLASLVVRFRRAGPDERRQVQWFLYAVAMLLGGNWLLPNDGIIAEMLLALSLTSFWVAIAIAMLRYRLYDIELLINRTIVYGVLTTLVVGLYVVIVVYLGALVQSAGVLGSQGGLPLQLAATVAVAVLFQPLRERLQRAANRLLYGQTG